jgi:biotin transporter BioY
MLVWANSHGGFLVGFILMAAFLMAALIGSSEYRDARRARRPLLAAMVACGAASLMNPVGAELWVHTTGYLDIRFLVDATQEYRSVDFHAGYGRLFFVCLFAGPVVWMTGRARVSALAGGLYLFFAATALHSARNIPLFTVASLPWLALWVDQWLLARVPGINRRVAALERIDRNLMPGAGLLLGLGLVWFALGPNRVAYQFDDTVFPVEMVRTLDPDETSGAVFNQMIWGGYLLYQRPDIPVFIDGQTDFYGEELSREYIQVLKGRQGWREVLDRYGVQWTLVANGEPVNQLLALDPDWELRRTDRIASMYWRVDGE